MGDHEPQHRELWESIPWVVNGSASGEATRMLDAHMRACADCRDEFAFHLRLHAGMNAHAETASNAHASLRRLLTRIDAGSSAPTAPVAALPTRPARRRFLVRGLAAAVVVQALALGVLGSNAWRQSSIAPDMPEPQYTTLSSTPATSASAVIRFVPAPTLSVALMHDILADAGLRIVDSSPHSAIYGLAPARTEGAAFSTDDAVRRLRSHAQVLFAEPIATR